MTVTPMKYEADRVLFRLLAAGCAVHLPDVGTLRVVRREARRTGTRRLEPSFREVDFSSDGGGLSFVEELARAAGCDQGQAREIYDRWLAQSREGEELVIGGVGTLRQKSFVPEAAFEALLNPGGRAAVALKPRRSGAWVCWVGAAAVLAGVACGGWLLWQQRLQGAAAERASGEVVAAVAPVGARVEEHATEAAGSGEGILRDEAETNGDGRMPAAAGESGAAQVPGGAGGSAERTDGAADAVRSTASADGAQLPTAPAEAERMTSGRTYVVLGVFSSEANALRAARTAAEQGARSRVYRFGAKFMVSLYEAGTPGEARAFMTENGERWPDLWPYTAK